MVSSWILYTHLMHDLIIKNHKTTQYRTSTHTQNSLHWLTSWFTTSCRSIKSDFCFIIFVVHINFKVWMLRSNVAYTIWIFRCTFVILFCSSTQIHSGNISWKWESGRSWMPKLMGWKILGRLRWPFDARTTQGVHYSSKPRIMCMHAPY